MARVKISTASSGSDISATDHRPMRTTMRTSRRSRGFGACGMLALDMGDHRRHRHGQAAAQQPDQEIDGVAQRAGRQRFLAEMAQHHRVGGQDDHLGQLGGGHRHRQAQQLARLRRPGGKIVPRDAGPGIGDFQARRPWRLLRDSSDKWAQEPCIAPIRRRTARRYSAFERVDVTKTLEHRPSRRRGAACRKTRWRLFPTPSRAAATARNWMCSFPPMAWWWCIMISGSIRALTRQDGDWLTGETPRIKDLSFAELQAFDLGRADPASDYARGASRAGAGGRRADSVPGGGGGAGVAAALSRLLVELKSSNDPASADPIALADAALAVMAGSIWTARSLSASTGAAWRGSRAARPTRAAGSPPTNCQGDARPVLDDHQGRRRRGLVSLSRRRDGARMSPMRARTVCRWRLDGQ